MSNKIERQLHHALRRLFTDEYATQNNWGVAINGELVIMYAKQLLDETNRNMPDTQKIHLEFSKRWMERFRKRYNLRLRRVQGESLSAHDVEMREKLPQLMHIISTYPERDVWNADEFGLFYRQPPSWTLSNRACSGSQK